MEIYEVLYTESILHCEANDLISFTTTDVDGETINEQMVVDKVFYRHPNLAQIEGFSDVLNDQVVYLVDADFEVNILGG